MSTKLPKHIAQLVEKNNLVMAIKSLAEEQGISMGEAKVIIDDYEESLKDKQSQKVAAIAAKQEKKQSSALARLSRPKDTASTEKVKELNAGLDQHLQKIGYKKPLVPYWVKRVFIILLIMLILIFVFWQLMP